MRALLYAIGSSTMFLAGLALASLPLWPVKLWLFMLSGAVLSSAIAGGWLLVGATAGEWPRPRTCHVLLLAGAVGTVAGIWTSSVIMLGWSALFLVAGAGFLLPGLIEPRSQNRRQRKSGVKPPIGRREQG